MSPGPEGRQISFPRDRQHSVASPEPGNAPEHETDKPQSLEAAKVSFIAILESHCSHRFEILPVCFASTNELSTRSLRTSHGSVGRVPSPGAALKTVDELWTASSLLQNILSAEGRFFA